MTRSYGCGATGTDEMSYHGRDAVTRVILDGEPERPLVARVRGTDVIEPGTRVTNPVHAWAAEKGRMSDPKPTMAVTAGGESAALR